MKDLTKQFVEAEQTVAVERIKEDLSNTKTRIWQEAVKAMDALDEVVAELPPEILQDQKRFIKLKSIATRLGRIKGYGTV